MLSVLLICKFKELTKLGASHPLPPPPQACTSPESVLPSKTSITHFDPPNPKSGEDPDERMALG